jgi:uncharacterized repeat protein (TIGR03803 family)
MPFSGSFDDGNLVVRACIHSGRSWCKPLPAWVDSARCWFPLCASKEQAMFKPQGWSWVGAVSLVCVITALASPAQVFKSLLNFEGNDGFIPTQTLTQGPDGDLYGTTTGGSDNSGTVFSMTRPGTLTTLYQFCTQVGCPDGANPSGLVLGTDGNFYGVTYGGGANGDGTVFQITSRGSLTTLYSFCSQANCEDGDGPRAALMQASDGNFYGTTWAGGTGTSCVGGCGTAFRITPAGKLTTLHSFDLTDGWTPNGLIEATNGKFYGTTQQGGPPCDVSSAGCGTVFEMTFAGTLTTLYTFCPQAGCPDGDGPTSLVQASDGKFYGTTVSGGIQCSQYISPCGTIFKITPLGALTTLHSFDLTDGANPNGALIQATDGMFYGTTWYGGNTNASGCTDTGCGTVFRMNSTGAVTTLHSFENTDGSVPFAGLLQLTSGNFYGTTTAGGDMNCVDFEGNGCGTVFALSTGLAPFVAFVHGEGKIGQTAAVLGQALTRTTSVSFNGTPAEFKVISSTLLTFTVPSGAKTGSLTVTTPSGTLTSNESFYVLP